jgi:glutaredoxin
MRCPRHDLATAADGRCVRCRREEASATEVSVPQTGSRRPRIVAFVAGALVLAAAVAWGVRSSSTVTAIPVERAAAPYVPPSAPPLAALDPAAVAPDPSASSTSSSNQSALERATHLAKITLYSRPSTPDCGRARTFLLAHGYVFKERDVDADEEARAAWRRAIPDGTVPAFDIDGQTFGGYDPARIQAALDYAGARRLQR